MRINLTPKQTSAYWIYPTFLILNLFLGLIPVKAEMVESYRVRLGCFDNRDKAEAFVKEISKKIDSELFIDEVEGAFFITCGDYQDYPNANEAQKQVDEKGFSDTDVVEVLTSFTEMASRQTVYHIQIDNYRTAEEASQIENQLKSKGISEVHQVYLGGYYKVRVGNFPDRDPAIETLKTLRESGYPYCWLVQSEQTKSWTEEKVVSVREAVPPKDSDPEKIKLPQDARFQVIIGPYKERTKAEGVMKILERMNEYNLRLVETDKALEIEVDIPQHFASAEALVIRLKNRGFSEASLRGPQTTRILSVAKVSASMRPVPSSVEVVQTIQTEEEAGKVGTQIDLPEEKPVQNPLQQKALQHLETAKKLMEYKDYQAARSQFEIALNLDPTHPDIIEGLTLSKEKIQQEEDRKRQQERLELYLTSAQKLMNEKKWEAARDQFQLAQDMDPENSEVLAGLDYLEKGLGESVQKTEEATASVSAGSAMTEKPAPIPDPAMVRKVRISKKGWFYSWGWILILLILVGLGILFFITGHWIILRKPSPIIVPKVQEQASSLNEKSKPDPAFQLFTIANQSPETVVKQIQDSELYPTAEPEESWIQEEQGKEIKPGFELVMEHTYDAASGKNELDNWRGSYESSNLNLYLDTKIAPGKSCLKFEKRAGDEEVLYCTLLPESGSLPVLEIEFCCLQVNAHPLGFYLESVDDESVSIPATFSFDEERNDVQFSVGNHSIFGKSKGWHWFRLEVDLRGQSYSIFLDENLLEDRISLPSKVENLDLLSLKAGADSEGILLLGALRIYRRSE